MKRFCSIISCFLAITILISSSVVTAHAAVSEPFTTSFWQWAGGLAQEEATTDKGYVGYLDYLKAAFSRKDSGCTSSQSKNGCHYWQLISDLPVSSITGKFRVKCQYCGMYYADYSSCDPEKEAETAYSNNVSTLPASGYDSAGKLLWQPKWSDFSGNLVCCDSSTNTNLSSSVVPNGSFPLNYSDDTRNISFCTNGSSFSISAGAYSSPYYRNSTWIYLQSGTLNVPISGNYYMLSSDYIEGSYLKQDRSSLVASFLSYSRDYYARTLGFISSDTPYVLPYSNFFPFGYMNGSPCLFNSSYLCDNSFYFRSCDFTFYTPVFAIEPISDTTTINNTYNINTRVNNFQGNYYNNVTNNYYNNTTIINETTNNYYDMTTNNYYTMSNWSYDYQSRTYFVTLEDGTTITVQFGDDCLTITNNNVENSYQYVINNNNTPSPNPETPATCKHNWTETIDVAPTCLEGGHANFTCSLCGETYEQILSAKGHNWTVKEHVNTVYGESGVIVTQGHTLYECSACGEQWYTETATPPPDVSGGSNILAWLQEFKTWLGDKLDNLFQGDGDTNNFWNTNKKSFTDVLSSLLQTLLDFLTDILEKLLGLVKDLLSFLFDLLSSVVITGISDFFTGLKDSRLFDFVTKDDEGSAVALPEGVATVFAFFSGVILALPVELRSILLFGTAIIVLIGVIKIIKS